eukprot:SAG31_NODE_1661_length_7596_cov_4.503802_1_plen_41_part_10
MGQGLTSSDSLTMLSKRFLACSGGLDYDEFLGQFRFVKGQP